MMNKYEQQLNEQFKSVVKNIKDRNNSLKQLDAFIENIKNTVPKEEIEKQFKSLQFDFVKYYGTIYTTDKSIKQCLIEGYDLSSHLPYGDVENKNSLAAHTAVKLLRLRYGFAEWQFTISNQTNTTVIQSSLRADITWQLPIMAAIPEIENNIDIIIREMQVFGYYNSVKSTRIVQGKPYVYLMFFPNHQDTIGDYIRNNNYHIYHASPIFNDESIMKNGFVPSCKSLSYTYSPRIFFNVNKFNWDVFVAMMNQVSHTHIYDDNYTDQYYVYELDINKIPENVEFYADPAAIDCCYTKDPIPYSAVVRKTKEIYKL